jgi:hypothetical protein
MIKLLLLLGPVALVMMPLVFLLWASTQPADNSRRRNASPPIYEENAKIAQATNHHVRQSASKSRFCGFFEHGMPSLGFGFHF